MIIRQLRQVSGRAQVTTWCETLITRHVHLSEVDKILTAKPLTNRRVLLKTTDSNPSSPVLLAEALSHN
jgi:chorismate-pyruvate lyase